MIFEERDGGGKKLSSHSPQNLNDYITSETCDRGEVKRTIEECGLKWITERTDNRRKKGIRGRRGPEDRFTPNKISLEDQ